MGDTYVTVTVRNPRLPHRSWEGRFLVDTGAMDCLVPRTHLEAIGINPQSSRTYRLADGSEAEFDVGVAQIEFMGEILGGRVMFADSDTQPLLGLTALESAGMLVDPEAQQLIRRPYLRL